MSTSDGDFERLERALDVFAAWDAGGRVRPPEELIVDHPALREVLEPLIADALGLPAGLPPDDVPREIGGFRIEYEVGRGAMGVVYAARQLALDRMVALKVLPCDSRSEPRTVARFRRESELLAALKHPSLVEVLTVGRDEGCEYFAMELIDGVPLNRVLRELDGQQLDELDGTRFGSAVESLIAEGPTGSRSACKLDASGTSTRWHRTYFSTIARIGWQVSDALAHAHDAGVLHRDVKTSNILLRNDGRAMLADFGLAREVGRPSLTQSGEFAGTPYYAAPEQVLGNARDLDGRVDVFSLGVVLYELLTLRRPFEGANSHEVAQAVLTVEPKDPQSINRRIPTELAAITLRALEKDPKRRYQSASELAADLEAFLEHRPVRARKVGVARRLQRFAQREPWQAALLGLLVLALPSLAWLAGYLQARAPLVAAGEAELLQRRVDAQLERATMRLELDGAEAIPMLREMLALDPTNADTIGMLVWACCDKGDGMSIEELDGIVAAADLEEQERRLLRVPVLFRLGREDEVAELQQQAGPATTSIAAFYSGLASLARGHRTNDAAAFRTAAEAFERAILMSARQRPLYLNKLAHALGHAGDNHRRALVAETLYQLWPDSAAQQYWSYFAEKDSDRSRARERLQRAIDLRGDIASLHYNLGTSFMKSGLHAPAVAPFERAIELADGYAPAHSNLSKSMFRLGRTEDAIAIIGRAIELEPNNAMFVANRGQYRLSLGRVEEARRDHAHALSLDPGQPIALSGLAHLLNSTEGAEACSTFCAEKIDEGHGCEELYRYLVMSLTNLRRNAEAVAAADSGLAKYPRSHWLHMRRAIAVRSIDREQAIASARRALRLVPNHPLMHGTLGNMLTFGKSTEADLEAAAQAYTRQSQLSPRTGSAYRNLAVVLMRLGRTDEAVTRLRDAIEVMPEWADGYEALGSVLLDTGQLEEAIVVLEAGLEAVPHDPAVTYRLAFALHRQAGLRRSRDDLDGARAAVRRGLELLRGRSDAKAVEMRSMLEQLRASGG